MQKPALGHPTVAADEPFSRVLTGLVIVAE